jgi:hypothetical protein
MKRFKELTEELFTEGDDRYPADDMTMSELKIAINAAQNILDMLEDGAMIQRWQISAIVKASDELASVCTNMRADVDEERQDEEEWLNGYEEDEEPMYVGYEYPSMYGEETDYEVDVEGLPKMFVKANSPAEVKNNLRKVVKNPEMIRGVERVAKATLQKIFRDKATGKDEVKEEVELDEASDLRITKIYNKKKATYAVHSLDRKYFKEFDTMDAAKAHHAEKTGK